jgi:large subunit ribosomal protein L3
MAGPCVVTQIKKIDTDGYWAIQLGFSSKRARNTPKSLQGHLKKITNDKLQMTNEDTKTQTFPRYLREVRLEKEP